MQFAKFCWLVFAVFWIVSAFRVKPIKERQSRSGRMALYFLPFVTFLAAYGICQIPGGAQWIRQRHWPDSDETELLGNGLTLAGLCIAIWARIILGGNWSSSVTFKEGHELIERGPYRFVRHPIYTGVLLMVLGTVVLGGRGAYFVALAASLFAFGLKMQQEEELLTRHFPDTYPAYKTRTKKLIPFLF